MLGEVRPRLAGDIQRVTGRSVAGYTHVIDGGDLRHILRGHGQRDSEAARGQAPIRRADIARLGTIIAKGRVTGWRPRASGKAASTVAIEVDIKRWRYGCILQMRTQQKHLALKTMWKRKRGK